MALKLRRRTGMFTMQNITRSSARHPNPLGTGAGSFKRVLGSRFIVTRRHVQSQKFPSNRNEHLRIGISISEPRGLHLNQVLGELTGARASTDEVLNLGHVRVELLRARVGTNGIPIAAQDVRNPPMTKSGLVVCRIH